MAHIPAPWRVCQPEPSERPAYRIRNGADLLVATVPIMAHPGADDSANLIAAAPDLLAALKAINERINSLAQDGNKKPHTNDIRDWQRWSAAAIAKAEGR